MDLTARRTLLTGADGGIGRDLAPRHRRRRLGASGTTPSSSALANRSPIEFERRYRDHTTAPDPGVA